ncbi:MAG: MFS transporter [Myxococcales bacterium]|nr:MFS transporter [Myxococcales bacterium]
MAATPHASPPGRKLRLTSKLSYGIGQVAEGIKNNAFNLLLLFYYVQVLGVPGSWAGGALFIAQAFDAVTDPIAGFVSDGFRSRWGRRHPFMYASALPLSLCFYLLFVPPAGLSQLSLALWLTVMAVLTRGAMTLYHVPHIALGAELTEDYEERSAVVAHRTAFGFIGMLAVVVMVARFFPAAADGSDGKLIAENYGPFAVLGAVLISVTILLSALGTHGEIPHLPPPPQAVERFAFRRAFEETLSALRNQNFLWLFVGVLMIYVMVGTSQNLNMFLLAFFWELPQKELSIVLGSFPLGMILGAPLTRYLHRRVEKKTALVFGTGWFGFCTVAPPLLRLLDLFPANGTPPLFGTLLGFGLLQGIGVVQAMVSFGSMMADVIDQHELQTGRRQEGVFFGAISFSAKGSSGLGGLIGGVGLDLIRWPRGSEIKSAADVDPQTIVHLGVVYAPAVALFAFISVAALMRFSFTRAEHASVLAALHARRKPSTAALPGR